MAATRLIDAPPAPPKEDERVNRTSPPASGSTASAREGGGHAAAATDPHRRPWTPDEPEPPGGWPAAPDAVPCVVSEWVLKAGRGGLLETRPVHSWLPRPVAGVKDDGREGARVRRFARAWAALTALQRSVAPARPALCRCCVHRLMRAGVLRGVPTRRGGGTQLSSREPGPKSG